MKVFRKSYKRVREHAKGDPVAYPFCPKGAWISIALSNLILNVSRKGLAPLGRLLQNLTNHLCLLHDWLFLCDSSFNFLCFLLIFNSASRYISSKQQFLLPESICSTLLSSLKKRVILKISVEIAFCSSLQDLRLPAEREHDSSGSYKDLWKLLYCKISKLAKVLLKRFGAFSSPSPVLPGANFD